MPQLTTDLELQQLEEGRYTAPQYARARAHGPDSRSPLRIHVDSPIPSPPTLSRHRTTMSPLGTDRSADLLSQARMRHLVDFILRCNEEEINELSTHCSLTYTHFFRTFQDNSINTLCIHGVNPRTETCNECIQW